MSDPKALDFIGGYQGYLQTNHWRRVRWAILWITGGRCALCGEVDNPEVHHNNYDNLFNETPADLTVLCARHHRWYSEKELTG